VKASPEREPPGREEPEPVSPAMTFGVVDRSRRGAVRRAALMNCVPSIVIVGSVMGLMAVVQVNL